MSRQSSFPREGDCHTAPALRLVLPCGWKRRSPAPGDTAQAPLSRSDGLRDRGVTWPACRCARPTASPQDKLASDQLMPEVWRACRVSAGSQGLATMGRRWRGLRQLVCTWLRTAGEGESSGR